MSLLKRSRDEFERDHSPTAAHAGSPSPRPAKRTLLEQDSEPERAEAVVAADPLDQSREEQTPTTKSARKKRNKRARREAEANPAKSNYPTIGFAPDQRLERMVKVGDLQALVLYILADGPAPQFVGIRHKNAISKVVMLMVPGLELGMFDQSNALDLDSDGVYQVSSDFDRSTATVHQPASPDDFYPRDLHALELAEPLEPLSDIFQHVWPIRAAVDEKSRRLHPSVASSLTVRKPRSNEKNGRTGAHWKNEHCPITTFIATVPELRGDGYPIHPLLLETAEEREREIVDRQRHGRTEENGWADTKVDTMGANYQGFGEQDRPIYTLDCEMVKTSLDPERLELARITIIDWDKNLKLDTLVTVERPVIDYLTPYSGITKDKLDKATTSFSDVREILMNLLTPDAILIGHALYNDLNALKLVHHTIVDSAMLFPHPRGGKFRSSLRALSERFLNRRIQVGSDGHDSKEDAEATLELVKQKCLKGARWGTVEANGESIFERIGRANRPGEDKTKRSGAVVDWGFPLRGHGASAFVAIACQTDKDVVDGVSRAVNGDSDGQEVPGGGVDFVWARLRELEAVAGWWNTSKTRDNDDLRKAAMASAPLEDSRIDKDQPIGKKSLVASVRRAVEHIQEIYNGLPPCTAFIVFSGTGNPTRLQRWYDRNEEHRGQRHVGKGEAKPVPWSEKEDRELTAAFAQAKNGLALITVK